MVSSTQSQMPQHSLMLNKLARCARSRTFSFLAFLSFFLSLSAFPGMPPAGSPGSGGGPGRPGARARGSPPAAAPLRLAASHAAAQIRTTCWPRAHRRPRPRRLEALHWAKPHVRQGISSAEEHPPVNCEHTHSAPLQCQLALVCNLSNIVPLLPTPYLGLCPRWADWHSPAQRWRRRPARPPRLPPAPRPPRRPHHPRPPTLKLPAPQPESRHPTSLLGAKARTCKICSTAAGAGAIASATTTLA